MLGHLTRRSKDVPKDIAVKSGNCVFAAKPDEAKEPSKPEAKLLSATTYRTAQKYGPNFIGNIVSMVISLHSVHKKTSSFFL